MERQATAVASLPVRQGWVPVGLERARSLVHAVARRLVYSAWLFLLLLGVSQTSAAGLFISEILFNPPDADRRTEYIELRGTPNSRLPLGTCLLAVEGDTESNPGKVINVFDLSHQFVGGNGFLVLLQNESVYMVSVGANQLMNADGAGWGSGSESSIGHAGEKGIVELKNASVTFLLVRTARWIAPGDDLDADDDGALDPTVVSGWEHLDSIGILDADGVGDIAYGNVNFRRKDSPGNSALALGKIVSLDFTPAYVGRRANAMDFTENSWAAARNLKGMPPAWEFGGAVDCWPATLAGAVLNHLGLPNFGAPALPGVVAEPSDGLVIWRSGGLTNFSISVTTTPSGPVRVLFTSSPGLELSIDGITFSNTAKASLTDKTPHTIFVKASDETDGFGLEKVFITGRVVSSGDAIQYPLATLMPSVPITVVDEGFLLLNEVKVNPPGTNDGPYEFVELSGTPLALLRNIYVAVIDGRDSPGTLTYLRPLNGRQMGANGLMFVGATDSPYAPASQTTFVPEPLFVGRGALQNSDASVVLLSTRAELSVGMDLDANDDGRMEAIPEDALVLDSLGWSESTDKLVYAFARIITGAAPDAVGRMPGDLTANDLAAWFYGDLTDGDPAIVTFDPGTTNPQFPPGVFLTPGELTRLPPDIVTVEAISGVKGDPTNPEVPLALVGQTSTTGVWQWSAGSTNQSVLPDPNISITPDSTGATASMRLNPTGVGYSKVIVFVSDGMVSNSASVLYAASSPEGGREAVWHLGASDGSTALPFDAEFMLIGDDENQGIRLYPRNRSSLPLAQYDFTAELQLPDLGAGVPREVDIEASTRAGNRILWIGSHGHSSFGEIRTNRTRLFATDIHGSGSTIALTFVGHYDYLKLDLIRWDTLNLHGRGTNFYGLEASDAEGVSPKAPDGAGFAIEGLAMLPRNTNAAYVAFRAPIVPASHRGRSLLVPVLNLANLPTQGGAPGSSQFGEPVELDLGGRGVRSIECNDGGYLIVAGPPGVGPSNLPADFRLFTWSGRPDEAVREHATDLTGLNPEGIIGLPEPPWTAQSKVNLLSDSGSVEFYGDGVSAKFLPIRNFKKCRSDWLELGAAVTHEPVTTSIGISADRVRLKWAARRGLTYIVEVCDILETPGWEQWAGPITANDAFAEAELSLEGNQKFMRVRALDGGM